MEKVKKESVAISARIDKNTFEKLDAFCDESGIKKTTVIEKALNTFIDDYYERQEIMERVVMASGGHKNGR